MNAAGLTMAVHANRGKWRVALCSETLRENAEMDLVAGIFIEGKKPLPLLPYAPPPRAAPMPGFALLQKKKMSKRVKWGKTEMPFYFTSVFSHGTVCVGRSFGLNSLAS